MWRQRGAVSDHVVNKKRLLLKIIRWLAMLMGLAILAVIFDYTIDFRPAQIESSYRFKLNQIPSDKAIFLSSDNLRLVLIKRSDALLEALEQQESQLQDPISGSSHQPDYARNWFRSKHKQYFVAYAMGTDLGCPIEDDMQMRLVETCGSANYDYAGRAIKAGNRYQNLTIPDYHFSRDFSILIVNP